MLQCLVVAVRPLLVEELAELLAFEFDGAPGGIPKYRPGLRVDDQTEAVLSTCSSLVTTIDKWYSYGRRRRHRKFRRFVQFSHFSVKEFLLSNRIAPSPGDIPQYQIRLGPAHTTLTQACLGLLLHSDDDFMVKRSPLADYAARHWIEHAQFENVASRVKDGMEILFDPDKFHFEAWVEIYDLDPRVHWRDTSEDPNPLYYSALCGFYDLVEHLSIRHPQYVNAIGGSYKFPLLAALGRGHVNVAQLLLKHGTDVDVLESTGKTMLLVALSFLRDHNNLLNIVEFLLLHGTDVNARDGTFTSSLHLAAEYGAQPIVKILLKHHADVNSQDNSGETPLHRLLGGGTYSDSDSDHVRLLLKHGAEANKRNKDNQTPFRLAVKSGWFRTAQTLLEHGADAIVENENNNGKSTWQLLSESQIYREDEVLDHARLLLKLGVEVNGLDGNKDTPLHLAIRWYRFRLARFLLVHGADANVKNKQGMTPLHILSQSNIDDDSSILDLLPLLLKNGSEVNGRGMYHETPLHLAIRWAQFMLVGALLEHGADSNAENYEGKTPFHELSQCEVLFEGDILNLATLLLKHGAELNRRDRSNEAPLHLAIQSNRFRLAKFLLEKGADPNVENNKGITPLQMLSQCDMNLDVKDKGIILNLLLLLLKHDADVNKRDWANNTPLHLAIRGNRFMIAETLLERGAGANVENNQGETPLHILSQSDFKDEGIILNLALLLMTNHGAEANKQNKVKDTPLHLAIRRNRSRLAGILLQHGADANAENNDGMTPLQILSESYAKDEHNILNVAQLLLKHGAEANRWDKANNTPLHLAVQRNRFMFAECLLEHDADANVENNNGQTPFQILSQSHIEDEHFLLRLALLLLKSGVNVNRLDNDNGTLLHLAIQRNRFKLAEILVEHGADTNIENNEGRTPLHILSESSVNDERNVLNLVKLLLKHGAELNRQDKVNNTPLHLAIQRNMFMIAESLLEHGADANAENNQVMTPLHLLSDGNTNDECNILDLLLLLLKNGAGVDRRDEDSMTPLHLAIHRGKFMIAGILLEHGANSNAETNAGVTPLHILPGGHTNDERNILNLAQLLLKHGAEVNRRDEANSTPLHLAIDWDRFMLTNMLLEHGADANVENNDGETPLHILSQSDIKDEGIILNLALLLLTNHDVEVNTPDKVNDTPLHLAIRRNRSGLVRILLEYGADSNAENNEGMTPLQILSESNEDERNILNLVQLLFNNGAEGNRRDKANDTPLHLAIRGNRFRIAEVLIEHGADTNAENNQGMTPLQILSLAESNTEDERKILNLFQLLLNNGADVNRRDKANDTPLHLVIRKKRFGIAETLIEGGADTNAENDQGVTPLHMLSEAWRYNDDEGINLNLVLLLLKNGAEVNRRDRAKHTPLHLAVRGSQFMVAESLLEHGADINAENDQGMTSVHMLSNSYFKDEGIFVNFLRLLLKNGAEVNRRDMANNTPLHLAIDHCQFIHAKLLLEHGADANAENALGQTPFDVYPLRIGISTADTYGASAWVWTRWREREISNLVMLSLNNGAKLNGRDKHNETPLHRAIQRGRLKLAAILLKHGADADAENNDGKTPLCLLSEVLSHDDGGDLINHARLFLKHAMQGNQQDEDNKTWLLLGIGEGKYKSTELLLSLAQRQL